MGDMLLKKGAAAGEHTGPLRADNADNQIRGAGHPWLPPP